MVIRAGFIFYFSWSSSRIVYVDFIIFSIVNANESRTNFYETFGVHPSRIKAEGKPSLDTAGNSPFGWERIIDTDRQDRTKSTKEILGILYVLKKTFFFYVSTP